MRIIEVIIQIGMVLLTLVIAPYAAYEWSFFDNWMIKFAKGFIVLMSTLIVWFVIYAITSRFYKN